MAKQKPTIDEIIRVVAEDLEYLRAEWHDQVTDAALRRGSVQLRHLLADGLLQRAWKAAGLEKEPRIRSVDLATFLQKHYRPHEIRFATAGGARYRGKEVGAIWETFVLPHSRPMVLPNVDPRVVRGLKEFTESYCMIVHGYPVRRREVVKYIANKLGGAHLDRSRNKPEDRVYQVLDTVAETIKQVDKDAVYFELLSIGQDIARSPDIDRFLSHVTTRA